MMSEFKILVVMNVLVWSNSEFHKVFLLRTPTVPDHQTLVEYVELPSCRFQAGDPIILLIPIDNKRLHLIFDSTINSVFFIWFRL